jgi:hypothetical protein
MSRDPVSIDTARVASGVEEVGISFRIPSPFDHRLNQLRDLLEEAGYPADRKSVVMALILSAPTDPNELMALTLRARKALVRDVVLDVDRRSKVISIPRSPVGRPRRQGRTASH